MVYSKYKTGFGVYTHIGINPITPRIFIIPTAGKTFRKTGRAGHACRGNHQQPLNCQVTAMACSKYKTRFWGLNVN
jgi:hypothetical protein